MVLFNIVVGIFHVAAVQYCNIVLIALVGLNQFPLPQRSLFLIFILLSYINGVHAYDKTHIKLSTPLAGRPPPVVQLVTSKPSDMLGREFESRSSHTNCDVSSQEN